MPPAARSHNQRTAWEELIRWLSIANTTTFIGTNRWSSVKLQGSSFQFVRVNLIEEVILLE